MRCRSARSQRLQSVVACDGAASEVEGREAAEVAVVGPPREGCQSSREPPVKTQVEPREAIDCRRRRRRRRRWERAGAKTAQQWGHLFVEVSDEVTPARRRKKRIRSIQFNSIQFNRRQRWTSDELMLRSVRNCTYPCRLRPVTRGGGCWPIAPVLPIMPLSLDDEWELDIETEDDADAPSAGTDEVPSRCLAPPLPW